MKIPTYFNLDDDIVRFVKSKGNRSAYLNSILREIMIREKKGGKHEKTNIV